MNTFFGKNKGKVVVSGEGFNGTTKSGGKLQVPENIINKKLLGEKGGLSHVTGTKKVSGQDSRVHIAKENFRPLVSSQSNGPLHGPNLMFPTDVESNSKEQQDLVDGPNSGKNSISTSEHMDVQVPGLYFSKELCNVVQNGDDGVTNVSEGEKGASAPNFKLEFI
ncbi:unnamed protein product [Lupinus luteus]|uniref:Uncharacterized protein n=1 Tax=Lupinus luteus TaxID=3873 RepID=A0AAV1XAI7_LUPLU